MTLPQLRAVLAACDRRDATYGILILDTVHSAVAPVFVGKEGNGAFKRCLSFLRGIIRPPTQKEKRESNAFGVLFRMAQQQDMERAAKKTAAAKAEAQP